MRIKCKMNEDFHGGIEVKNKDRLSLNELNCFLVNEFPQCHCSVISSDELTAHVRYEISEQDLRPGGSVSGPTLMKVADVALYIGVLSNKGLIPLALTTNFSINFFKKPNADKAIIGECQLLKVGKNLVVGQVLLFSEGEPAMLAHATGTYSIPPSKNLET